MLYVMMRMSTYLEDLENAGSAVIMGFRDKSERFPNGYPGTYVFETKEDCDEFIHKYSYANEGFEPFGIEADWNTETQPIGGSYKHHYLLVDKEYFTLPAEGLEVDA